MLKPPVARMGGKSKLRKDIIELFPQHTCYVEVFFGAGWVYFGKDPSKVEVINDVDGELINLFKMIKHHPNEFERQLYFDASSRDVFQYYLTIDSSYLTEIQRAARFYYLIKYSFGSKGQNYGYAPSSPPKKLPIHEYLIQLQERLKNTYIENLDFKITIEKYDRAQTLFFCDPPYYETAGYDTPFTLDHHLQLNNKLKTIKGKFLLTINNHPKIRDLYKSYVIKETQVNYSVCKNTTGRKNYNELIITNY